MAEPKALLYAELLANIRQISVMVSFNTVSDQTTMGELSADGCLLHLSHGGTTYTLPLPGQAVPTTHLQKTFDPRKELSWRLPVADLPLGTSVECGQGNEAPWPAKDLDPDSSFSCRGCGAIIVQADVIKSWRDLPSENWAEMMDFWHCHKPNPEKDEKIPQAGHNHDNDTDASKGYGANAKFIAQSGIGFVDLTSFLLADPDCEHIQIQPQEEVSAHPQKITCEQCKATIGHFDVQASGVRLHKWRLSLSSRPASPPMPNPAIPLFISARLLSILQAQCSSKALLIPESPTAFGTLHLWVLQQSLYYSSSKSRAGSRTFAMKVLWMPINDEKSAKLIDTQKAEDISLPGDTVVEIEKCLRESAQYLPPSARLFHGWNVGLLERYEESTSPS